MLTHLTQRVRLAVASFMILSGLVAATGIAPSAASAANCTGSTAPCLDFTRIPEEEGFVPGRTLSVWFSLENISDKYAATDVVVRLTLPEGMSVDPDDPWVLWPQNDSLSYNATTRVVTFKPQAWGGDPGVLGPNQEASPWIDLLVADDVTATELVVKARATYSNSSGVAQTAAVSEDWVFGLSKPYILESTTAFTPSIVASAGSSTITSTISNVGTGDARSIYYYVNIDDRLTVDQASVPEECDYRPQEEWNGEVYQQYLSCHYEGVLAAGQTHQITVNVTAPNVAGPEEYEATTELSCTENSGASHDETEDGNSTALLRLNPPAGAELHVVQMGGPKPIAMPSATAEPDQPTAGKTHAVTTYVYNIGQADVSTPVTVVVTIPSGFTPTSITATTDDSAASAPVCTLSTRTCVFSQLAAGAQGRIVIEGDLSPTIAHETFLSVSAEASATSMTTVTDTNKFAVTAFAEAIVQLTSTGAFYKGTPVAFQLVVRNDGPSAIKSPVIKVTLPAGASFVSVPKGCTASGTTMTCKWSKLEDEGIDGAEFSARYASGTKATATAVLTTSTPLSKGSVTKSSASQELSTVTPVDRVPTAGVLPATGSESTMMLMLALMLISGGAALLLASPARRRTA